MPPPWRRVGSKRHHRQHTASPQHHSAQCHRENVRDSSTFCFARWGGGESAVCTLYLSCIQCMSEFAAARSVSCLQSQGKAVLRKSGTTWSAVSSARASEDSSSPEAMPMRRARSDAKGRAGRCLLTLLVTTGGLAARAALQPTQEGKAVRIGDPGLTTSTTSVPPPPPPREVTDQWPAGTTWIRGEGGWIPRWPEATMVSDVWQEQQGPGGAAATSQTTPHHTADPQAAAAGGPDPSDEQRKTAASQPTAEATSQTHPHHAADPRTHCQHKAHHSKPRQTAARPQHQSGAPTHQQPGPAGQSATEEEDMHTDMTRTRTHGTETRKTRPRRHCQHSHNQQQQQPSTAGRKLSPRQRHLKASHQTPQRRATHRQPQHAKEELDSPISWVSGGSSYVGAWGGYLPPRLLPPELPN